MSEMHTIAPKRALTNLALSLGILGTFAAPAAFADGEQSLQNVAVDNQRQLVVQFAGGSGAPQAPKLTEVKSPNHQLYIEFADTTLDDNAVPASDQLTRKLASQLPGLRRALIGVVPNAASPTVRVVLDLDPDLAITPSVANLRDGAAVISLGEAVSHAVADVAAPVAENTAGSAPEPIVSDIDAASASAPTPSPSSTSDPTAAYEEYYRKFLQQKQLTKATVPAGDWKPRTGTLSEANAVKKQGIRIIGTPIQSPALQDLPETSEAAPTPKSKRAPAPTPASEVVAEVAPQATAETAPAAAQPAAQVEEAPTPGKPTVAAAAEVAPEETVSQPAEAAPVAAAQKEEAVSAAQPDMVAGEEPAVEPAAPAPVKHQLPTPVKKAPVAKAAPSPGRRVAQAAAAVAPVAGEEESASAPSDATAAAGGADQEANMAENESPAASESPKLRAAKLFNSGLKNHMQGRVTQAITQYQQALKLNPELGCAHGNLGLAYNQMHNYDSALTEFHKALAVNPRDAITYNGIGAALRAEHDMPGAIKNWQTAVKLDPKMAVAHFNLGTAYELEGDPEQAMVSYQAAVTNDPKFGEAFYRMGLIMQKRHRLQDAKSNFKKALNISADSDYAADAKLKIAAIDKISK